MNNTTKNYLFNLGYQLLIIVIPFVVLPYLVGVLGSDQIGVFSYTFSIVQYFQVFVYWGIGLYASKTIATFEGNVFRKAEYFWSTLLLKIVLGIIVAIIYLLYIIVFARQYKTIFMIQILFLASASIDTSWYYIGTQEFRNIFIRNIFIKVSAVFFVFLVVKKHEHLWIYVLILGLSEFFGQVLLLLSLLIKIRPIVINTRDVCLLMQKSFPLFLSQAIMVFYLNIDRTILGVVSTKNDLGIYEIGQKIIRISSVLVTSMGLVMLPKISQLHARGEGENKKNQIESAFKFAFILALPMAVGLFFVSENIVGLFFGSDLSQISLIIKILSLTIILLSVNNVVGMQILIPLGMDIIYLYMMLLGIIVNLIANLFLSRLYGSIGSSVAFIASECIMLLYGVVVVKRLRLSWSLLIDFIKCALSSILMGAVVWKIGALELGDFMTIVLKIVTGISIYVLGIYIFNIEFVIHYINRMLKIDKA